MGKKKIVAIILIIIGVALLLGSAAFWYDSLKSASPPGVGENVRDWITAITGVISCLIGVLTYFKKDKQATKTDINVTSGSLEIASGENARNIRSDTYFEKPFIEYHKAKISPLDVTPTIPSPPADFTGRKKEKRSNNPDSSRFYSQRSIV